MTHLGTWETVDTRLQRLRSAMSATSESMGETVKDAVDLEARRRTMADSLTRFREEAMFQRFEQRERTRPTQFAAPLKGPGFGAMVDLDFSPEARARREAGLAGEVAPDFPGGGGPVGPFAETAELGLRGAEVAQRRLLDPTAALGLQVTESPLGDIVPGVSLLKDVTGVATQLGAPEEFVPTPRRRTFGGAFKGGIVRPELAAFGNEEEQQRAQDVLAEAGFPRALAAQVIFDWLNLAPVVGFTKADDLARLIKGTIRLTGKARTGAVNSIRSSETAQKLIRTVQSEVGARPLGGLDDLTRRAQEVRAEIAKLPAGDPRRATLGDELRRLKDTVQEAEAAAGKGIPERPPSIEGPVENPHVRAADPGPPKEPPGPPARPRVPSPDDPEFRSIQDVALEGEKPGETLIRRHQGALGTGTRRAAVEVREVNQMLKEIGLGRSFRGSVVAKEEGAFKELNSLLHNPSKVASGERVVPDELRPVYDRLRAGTDWEQAARVDFDPDMALADDYFFRGWQAPEGMFTGEARGALGRNPAFRMPRVNATYDEMIELGFKPLFENPAEQARYSQVMGVKYREQMRLVEAIKARELALPHDGGPIPDGWRVPRVGPAFEGKPFAKGTDVMYTRRWAVPDSLANRLENAYGVIPRLGKGEIFGKTVDFQKAVDAAVFMPKRAKLLASVFQHVDFLNRSHIGAWTGFIDALRRGQPVDSVYHLLKWPKSAADIVRATFSPNFRNRLAKLALDDTPLFEGRKLSRRMISDAGLSVRDETLFPELDQVIREVAAEGRLAKWGKAPFRLLADFERSWRKGLFEGVYPAAIWGDVENNIAPMVARQHPNATDEQWAGMIAKAGNISYSTVPAATSVVQNQQARWFLTRFLFSLNENEGLLRTFTGAIRGENAAYFRTRLLGIYLGMMTLANTIHFASTGEPLPFNRYTPISKDKWGPLPFGYNRDFAAPNIPLTGRSGAEITLDLMGQMDTAFRILNPKSFLNARTSVPVRAGQSQITGKDFFGAPIDTVGPGGIFSRTAQLITDLFAPIGAGQAGLQLARSNIEEVETLIPPGEDRLGTVGTAVQATGLNLRAETTPQLLDRIRGDVMREMEIQGSYEDIKATDAPLGSQIDDEVEKRIGQELELRRETARIRGQISPESRFFEAAEDTRVRQGQEQLASDQKLNTNEWAGDVWRDDKANRAREFFARRDELAQEYEIDFEADKGRPPPGSVNEAIEAYFGVNVDDPKYERPDGLLDWDAIFKDQDAALSPLSSSDRKRVKDWIHKHDTPTVKEFRPAAELIGEILDTPKFKGMSEDGWKKYREFQRLVTRETERLKREATQQGVDADMITSTVIAIVIGQRSPEWDSSAAYFVLDSRGDAPLNLGRMQKALDNQDLLAKFYPDLLGAIFPAVVERTLVGQPAFERIAGIRPVESRRVLAALKG